MPRRVLARGRAACARASGTRVLGALVALALAVAAAGCTSNGTGSSAVTVSGKTLTIYLSGASSSQPEVAADVLHAEQLAFSQQSSHQIGSYSLALKVLSGAKISDDARTAIQDQSAIAYLGEVVPHSSYASLGITNAVQLLQISPTDTALELTQATPAVPGAPDIYYQSLSTYGRTFARVVPTSGAEAKAQVQEMQALGVSKVYVTDDGGPYGKALAAAIKQDATGKLTVVSSQAGADGVFYGSNAPASATHFFDAAASGGPVKLFAPSALYDPGFASALSASVRNLYVSVPGFRTQDLTPGASQFVSQFQTAYGHAPAPQAIFGYEAMAGLLAVLREAGAGANSRSTVVKDFFGLRNRQSVLGTYSIDANGDTSIAPFMFGRLQGGKLVPFAQVQG